MIAQRHYGVACWWCGGVADSREHRYKKADVVRQFGAGPYRGEEGLVRGIEQSLRTIQGPRSREITFPPNLCQRCNSGRSQLMDRAYDRFISRVHESEEAVLETRSFAWSDIFPEEWESGRDNVKRYLAKHVGSRLASAHIEVGEGIISFLNAWVDQPQGLDLRMEIREDIVALQRRLKSDGLGEGSLWIGDLEVIHNPTTGALRNVRGFYGYRWLRINYEYDDSLRGASNFEGDAVHLSADFNVNPSEVSSWDPEHDPPLGSGRT